MAKSSEDGVVISDKIFIILSIIYVRFTFKEVVSLLEAIQRGVKQKRTRLLSVEGRFIVARILIIDNYFLYF